MLGNNGGLIRGVDCWGENEKKNEIHAVYQLLVARNIMNRQDNKYINMLVL